MELQEDPFHAVPAAQTLVQLEPFHEVPAAQIDAHDEPFQAVPAAQMLAQLVPFQEVPPAQGAWHVLVAPSQTVPTGQPHAAVFWSNVWLPVHAGIGRQW